MGVGGGRQLKTEKKTRHPNYFYTKSLGVSEKSPGAIQKYTDNRQTQITESK